MNIITELTPDIGTVRYTLYDCEIGIPSSKSQINIFHNRHLHSFDISFMLNYIMNLSEDVIAGIRIYIHIYFVIMSLYTQIHIFLPSHISHILLYL